MSNHAAVESVAFDSAQLEQHADRLGMWVLLGSEAMFFGAAVLAYLIARAYHGKGFAGGSEHLSFALGTANTAILLTSSLVMALAHVHAEANAWRTARRLILAAAALGAVFLAVKMLEYHREISEGLAPLFGIPFRYDGPDPTGAALFFNLYFVLTGLHAAHLLGGIGAILWVALLWRGTGAASRLRRVIAVGLYWHFVDVVWVFLYPLLYLINR